MSIDSTSSSAQPTTSNSITTSLSTSAGSTNSDSGTSSLPSETDTSSNSSASSSIAPQSPTISDTASSSRSIGSQGPSPSSSNDSSAINLSTTTTSSDTVTSSTTPGQGSASSQSTDQSPSATSSNSALPEPISSSSALISSFAPISSTQSDLPPSATTNIAEPIILKAAPFSGDDRGQTARAKRQAVRNGFVDDSGIADKTSCTNATSFELTEGQLLIDGTPISTNPDFTFVPLRGNSQGTIRTTFYVAGGILHWQNQLFFENRARFCQDDKGVTYATFVSNFSELLDCIEVDLVVSLESQCQNGQTISSNLPNPLTTPSESIPTTKGQQSTASETKVPHEHNIYPLDHGPGGADCFTTNLTWVIGQPTFIGI
ncbi:hypothetical protein F5Y18DRAFT_421938 [Xylariaceae sp. FL1019]|nr:hypothetical protein F5Y18DRAFT_421938 [Xylariaceae sp. FL1019]